MAEKFSIDDIISEYSEKVENDLKADESEDTDEVAEEDNSSQQEAEQDNEINIVLLNRLLLLNNSYTYYD